MLFASIGGVAAVAGLALVAGVCLAVWFFRNNPNKQKVVNQVISEVKADVTKK